MFMVFFSLRAVTVTDPDPVMAGAVAKLVKSLWSNRELVLDIMPLPFLGCMYVLQQQQLALVRETRMNLENVARGMVRE